MPLVITDRSDAECRVLQISRHILSHLLHPPELAQHSLSFCTGCSHSSACWPQKSLPELPQNEAARVAEPLCLWLCLLSGTPDALTLPPLVTAPVTLSCPSPFKCQGPGWHCFEGKNMWKIFSCPSRRCCCDVMLSSYFQYGELSCFRGASAYTLNHVNMLLLCNFL